MKPFKAPKNALLNGRKPGKQNGRFDNPLLTGENNHTTQKGQFLKK
jgi:hypothetical protein